MLMVTLGELLGRGLPGKAEPLSQEEIYAERAHRQELADIDRAIRRGEPDDAADPYEVRPTNRVSRALNAVDFGLIRLGERVAALTRRPASRTIQH